MWLRQHLLLDNSLYLSYYTASFSEVYAYMSLIILVTCVTFAKSTKKDPAITNCLPILHLMPQCANDASSQMTPSSRGYGRSDGR